MLKTKIAIFTKGDKELIVVPLDGSFHYRAPSQRSKAMKSLQRAAASAGLTAPIALVWRAGNKQYFIGPEQWHPFLSNLKWTTIISGLCAILTCPVELNESSPAESNSTTQSGSSVSAPHTLRTISTPDSARKSVTASH